MEITLVAENVLRVKGKTGTIVIDPTSLLKSKTQADAVIVLSSSDISLAKIEGHRVVINGPGEYEVSGIKMSGRKVGKHTVYELGIDGLSLVLTKIESVEAIKDKGEQCNVLILHSETSADSSGVPSLEPDVVCLYGKQASEMAKTLGKTPKIAEKYAVTHDKLPEEMEVVVLE